MQINKTAMHNTIELTLDAIALSFIFNKKAIIVQMQGMFTNF